MPNSLSNDPSETTNNKLKQKKQKKKRTKKRDVPMLGQDTISYTEKLCAWGDGIKNPFYLQFGMRFA